MLSFLLYILPALINIACIIHLFRNNKPWWWLLVIWLLSPYVGAIVYCFFEILPGLTGSSKSRYAPIQPARPEKLDKRIAELKQTLEFSDTVDIKLQLAEAYLDNNQPNEAIEIYTACNQGIFKDDPPILYGLAECQYELKQWQNLLDTLDSLDARKYLDYVTMRQFFRARALQELGQREAAIRLYRQVADAFPGEEARHQLAHLLEQDGNITEAREQYQEILKNTESADSNYRKQERDWIKSAEAALKELPK